jgi:hypothetical protein
MGLSPLSHIYHIGCKKCVHEYQANGYDVHLRKCPYVQGDVPRAPA